MKPLRLLTLETTESELTGAYEEAFIRSVLNGTSPDGMWLWKRPKGVYLTRNSSILYVDTEYAKSMGYPPIRTEFFRVAPDSSVIFGGEWGLITSARKDLLGIEKSEELQIPIYMALWRHVMEDEYGIKLETKGNDLVIEGTDRKLFGMVHMDTGTHALGNCMFSVEAPAGLDLVHTYRNLPASKLAGKNVKNADERMTNLRRETGREATREFIVGKAAEFLGTLGFTVTIDTDMNEAERKILAEVTPKHTSEDWLKYGRIYR